jgi:hypothetical protein
VADDLDKLLEVAKRFTPTPQHREEQRRSFAYGNTAFENELITRDMINAQAERLASEDERRK